MVDEPRRRSSDYPLGVRISVVEVEMKNLGQRLDEHLTSSQEVHKAQVALTSKLDERLDRMELGLARLLAGLAVAIFIGQLIAPTILKALGVIDGP